MTNDVRELKEHFIQSNNLDNNLDDNIAKSVDPSTCSFKIDEHVTERSTLRELVICDITSDGKYVCRLSHKKSILGTFSEEELKKI